MILACLLLLGMALVGCQPAGETTLPPATIIVGPAPAPVTAMQPTPIPSAAAVARATKIPSNPKPTAVPAKGDLVTLTIMHTTDNHGEVDPCG
jgi:2',3'-cyclic-nucleotide 2'-phosphodiesterase (5'-nucleotidase family)